MTKTIVILMTVLIALVAVTPAYADSGEIKPVCTSVHNWIDRLFGACVDLDNKEPKAKINVDLPTAEELVNMAVENTEKPFNEISETMTESNKVHDAVMSLYE